jgi:hypothetical protein
MLKKSSLLLILLISALFPWLVILPSNSDIQPNTLIIGLFILVILIKEIKYNLVIALYMLIPTAHLLIGGIEFNNIRGYFGYISFFILYTISNHLFLKEKENNNIYIYACLAYIFCGLVQMFYDPDFFITLSNRENGYNGFQGRGVESLAAEPTFLGFHLIFIFLLFYSNQQKQQKMFNSLIACGIFIISKSSSAIASILAGALPYLTIKKKILPILIIGGMTLILIVFFQDIRFVNLLMKFKDSPFDIISLDESLQIRYQNIRISFLAGMDNFLFGHGFNSFNDSLLLYGRDISVELNADRPTTFLGGIFFECGIFQLILITYIIYKSSFTNGRNLECALLFFFLIGILIQGIPNSYPLLPILLSKLRSHRYENINNSR